LESEPLADVDYTEVVDAQTFEPIARIGGNCYVLLAVRIGKTRLIDNLFVEAAGPGSEQLVFHL
jgi:pantoate--beta-alanine ligase